MLYSQGVVMFVEAGTLKKAKRSFDVTKIDILRLQREGVLQPSRAMKTAKLIRQMELPDNRLKKLMALLAVGIGEPHCPHLDERRTEAPRSIGHPDERSGDEGRKSQHDCSAYLRR